MVAAGNTGAFGGCEPSPRRTRDARECAAFAALARPPMLGSRSPIRARISGGDQLLSTYMDLAAARTRILMHAAALGALFLAVAVSGNLPSANEARDFGESLGGWALLAYVPLFVLANLLITWPILAGAAGLLFGAAAGTPLALAGVTVAGVVQMAIARRLAAGHHGSLLPQRTRALEDFLTRNGAVAVME